MTPASEHVRFNRKDTYEAVLDRGALPSKTLFHYTDRVGFAGILNAQQLWASHVAYLNDAQELLYGRKVIHDVLRDRAQGRSLVNQVLERLERTGMPALFVICFSEDGDALSQWRGYAVHGGYALGFPKHAFEKIIKAAAPSGLFPVSYDPQEHHRNANSIVDEFLHGIDSPEEEWTTEAIDYAALAFAMSRDLMAISMKDPSFAEEREWRLTFVRKVASTLYRPVKSHLMPYATVALDPDGSVVSDLDVVVGPTPHRELALQAARGLVTSKEGSTPRRAPELRFRNSVVPFRDW